MFAKFNYSPSNTFYNSNLNGYLTIGNKIYSKHKKEVQECLSEYISVNGIINGTKLKENWFSITHKDIFISHSHKDLEKVKAFAGWLYEEFELEAFIDSCSWGYCDDLLKKIDDKYCLNKHSNTYDYQLRNYTTSHVHMMLSTGLTQMMNETECIIFFNTPNSINMGEELNKIKNNKKTLSPWIYHELLMTTMLKSEKPNRKNQFLEHSSKFTDSAIKIEYDVTELINNMSSLKDEHLVRWNNEWIKRGVKTKGEALDVLYTVVCPSKNILLHQ